MTLTRRTLLQSSAAAVTGTSLALSACKTGALTSPQTSSHKTLMDDTTDMMLKTYPETSSAYGIDKGQYADLKWKLSDHSPEGQADIARRVKSLRARMHAADTSHLSADEALNHEVVQTVLDLTDEGFGFPYGDVAMLNNHWSYRNTPYVVAQNVGAFVDIPLFLEGSHAIETREDADAYLARLEAYADQINGETMRVKHDGGQGVILPDFLMDKTLGQMQTALDKEVTDWGVVTILINRTSTFGSHYAKAAKMLANDKIRPALTRQAKALKALAPQANGNAGIWDLPEGEAYYNWALRAGTTTTLSPDEVHEMGLEELASLHSRMDPILKSIGYSRGSVGERMTALGKDPLYQFSKGDTGRAEIMAFIDKALTDIRLKMPQAFETLVPGRVEVTRIPLEAEEGAPGAYGGPGSIDGKQPGRYWINLRTPDLHNKFSLMDLTYHEAIPGHVWQGEYALKQPLVRSLLGFNAYSEGWALYAEQIADELGVYDDYPVGRLGYLQSLAFRACRLVVDTGLHTKRWTRQQGIDFFVEKNGSNPEEVRSEVDRYCSWPGQACGYKIGHTQINRLRDMAQNTLGARYDFRRFNDALVLGGNVPMTILGDIVDQYIQHSKAIG